MTIASIDLGTNTVLLLIAKAEKSVSKIVTLVNEYRMPRIGKGLKPGGSITEEKIIELFEVLADYNTVIKEHNCEQVLLSATNALRIASNGKKILDEIASRYGWDCRIISGEEEARYSYLGAVSGIDEKVTTLIIDIGGGSTELVLGKGEDILFRKSYHAGVVSHTEKHFKHDPPFPSEINTLEDDIASVFSEIKDHIHAPDNTIAIAGTPTTLACIKNGLNNFNEEKIEGSTLSISEMHNLIQELKNLSSSEISERYKSVTKGREDLILTGSYILFLIMNILDIDKVIVSTKGIRYGAIVNYLKVEN